LGRRWPRRLVIAGDWFGAALLVPFVPAGVSAVADVLLGAGGGGPATWVFALGYGSLAVWGATLAAATWQYQRRGI
jgi:hypothetical protein